MSTMQKILAGWEKVGNVDKGHRLHLGASLLGDPCERKLWYSFRWALDIEFNGRILRLFDRGQREEQTFTDELRRIGIKVLDTAQDGNQWRFADCNGHVGGSMDGAAIGFDECPTVWCVAEYKTHGEKSFKTLQDKGVKIAKPLHYAQMNLYMYWSGMTKAFYLAVNKNTDDLHGEFIDYDKSLAVDLIAKAERIVNAKTAPARMTTDPSYYGCKFCDFAHTCHQDAVGAVNCRTCVHSTPIENAQWHCNRADAVLSEDNQREGCEQHLFIPDLVPYALAIDANVSENWIEYEKPNGEKFKNGGTDWPSIELVNLPAAHTNDEYLKQLREQFDGKVVA